MMKHNRWEGGLSLGVANSMTDVASGKANTQAALTDVYSRGMMPALGLYSRYRFNSTFALRGNLSGIMLKGNDRWSPDIDVVNRGRSFTNTLYETSLLSEFYLPRRITSPKKDFSYHGMDLYFFGGLALFYHSPEIKGDIIDDYDRVILQGNNIYDHWQFAIPFGAGIQWTIYNKWVLGVDFNFRYTFFDYLDGFRRPYSSRNDYYFTTGLKIGYLIESNQNRRRSSSVRHIFDNYSH